MARIPKNLSDLLHRSQGQLGHLVRRIQRQQSLLLQVKAQLPPEVHPHCLHSEISGGDLTLFMDTPAWANRAQFLGSDLIEKLDETGLRGIHRLRVRVLPQQGASSRGRRRKITLSTQSAALIESTAKTIEDNSLRASLLKLARRRRPNGD